MNIRIDSTPGRRIPRSYVTASMEKALKRIPGEPVTARVTFTDVNGPKKGVDIECALLLTQPGRPPMRVARRGTTPRVAFDLSYDIALRRLEELRERNEQSRRRPKKYYAAKRLLA